ncbi:MAG: helix-turn-helix domain-containing protein [Candidatus Omnitrophica bacterium]|nr:helix-turn-helix domain-containing protein [Candidatus Omnitrophota bacterium]
MSSIGSHLREARTRKGFSTEDVYNKIKIHPRVVEALEQDRFEALPSPMFVKSFIKTYADFLEINADELIQSYEKDKRKDPEQVIFIKPAHEKIRTAPLLGENVVRPILFVVLAAVVLFVSFFLLRSALNFVTSAKKAAPQKVKVKRSTPSVPAQFSSEWLRSPAAGNFPKIDKKEPLLLVVKATDNVWLRVTSDSKVLFESTLRKGAQEAWTAASFIEIWTGHPAGMQLTINNYPLGSLGRAIVKKMVVSHEGIKKLA